MKRNCAYCISRHCYARPTQKKRHTLAAWPYNTEKDEKVEVERTGKEEKGGQ
jgi:hypothetical protein